MQHVTVVSNSGIAYRLWTFGSTAAVQPMELIVWMTDVCLSSNFFQIATPRTVFVRFLSKFAHMIYVPIRKNCGKDFRNFALKIFGKFLKFYVSSGAL